MEQIFIDPQKRRNIKTLYNAPHLIEGAGMRREKFQVILEKVELMNLFVSRLLNFT